MPLNVLLKEVFDKVHNDLSTVQFKNACVNPFLDTYQPLNRRSH